MIELKNTLTREQFEAGHPFLVYHDSSIGSLKYTPPNPEKNFLDGGLEKVLNNEYVCGVSSINKTGFSWYSHFLGKHIKGRVLFSMCIPSINSQRN